MREKGKRRQQGMQRAGRRGWRAESTFCPFHTFPGPPQLEEFVLNSAVFKAMAPLPENLTPAMPIWEWDMGCFLSYLKF